MICDGYKERAREVAFEPKSVTGSGLFMDSEKVGIIFVDIGGSTTGTTHRFFRNRSAAGRKKYIIIEKG